MTSLIEYEYDVFLSHNHADAPWTEQLATRLERETWKGKPLKVFYSERDIRPGQSIPQRMQDALTTSRKVALILSPEALKSRWVELEYLATLYSDVSKRQEHLLPLMRRDCEPPYLVAPLRYIDFRSDEHFERSYLELLAVIRDEPLPRMSERPPAVANLPSPPIPNRPVVGFVARLDRNGRDIVERLRDELAPHKNQVVALWGAGGVGKTTLASEAVRSLAEAYAQRVVWISADQRSNLPFATFLDELAAQLGDEDLRRLALEQKIEAVRALINVAPTLVVLDNFETITPEDQSQCMELLADRARCTALITTRQRIERAVAIPIAAMSTEEANDFLQRLINQTQDPDIYTELDRNRLIQTAEANPLIIQWIVGQIDLANDPEEVLDELSQGEGDAAHRVFDRSFNLRQMADGGRAVLLALSLFTPSATRSALAEVAGMGKDKDKKRFKKAQETLASLWLIKKTEAGQRLSVAGLTRELTKAHLSADPRNKTFRQRFTARFLKYAEANAKPIPHHLNALEEEKDNILNAIDVASGLTDWRSVLRLMDSFGELLITHGYWDEAIRRGEQALEAAQNLQDEGAVARVMHNMAITFQSRGEFEEARRLYNESLNIVKRLDDQSGIASTLHQFGKLAQEQGELEEARRLYNESLNIKKRLDDQSGIATTLHNLATIAQEQGELEEARRLYDESLNIANRLGDQSGIASTLHQFGKLAQMQGELEEARRLYEESLDIEKRLSNQSGIAISLGQLGLLAAQEDDKAEAGRLLRESLSIFERLKSPKAEEARKELALLEGESS
jgi:tetratricopeptide (TPR) repeat protein